MRTTAAILFLGCLAAAPIAARGQTSILPPAASLNPHSDAGALRGEPSFRNETTPRGEALNARGEVPGGFAENLSGTLPGAAHPVERGRRGDGRPPHGRTCFSQAEARETIALHRLIDPVRALRLGRQQGDALSARLCRWTVEEFVYEIAVLRHDGRILHLFMNAQSGDAVSGASQAVQAAPRVPGKD